MSTSKRIRYFQVNFVSLRKKDARLNAISTVINLSTIKTVYKKFVNDDSLENLWKDKTLFRKAKDKRQMAGTDFRNCAKPLEFASFVCGL